MEANEQFFLWCDRKFCLYVINRGFGGGGGGGVKKKICIPCFEVLIYPFHFLWYRQDKISHILSNLTKMFHLTNLLPRAKQDKSHFVRTGTMVLHLVVGCMHIWNKVILYLLSLIWKTLLSFVVAFLSVLSQFTPKMQNFSKLTISYLYFTDKRPCPVMYCWKENFMILKMHVLFLPHAISTFSYAFSIFFYLCYQTFFTPSCGFTKDRP